MTKSNRICFLYTNTNGLHELNENVSKTIELAMMCYRCLQNQRPLQLVVGCCMFENNGNQRK